MIRLKALRLAKGFKTQKEFAEALNISKSTYNYWENEKIEIDYTSLNKLADYFGVSIDYLLGRTEDSNLYVEDNANIDNKNTVVSIGRGGKREIYQISEEDSAIVNAFLDKMSKKN